MISGEDESSSVLNGRLRPRKSTATISNTPNKSTQKPVNKIAQDKPKRKSTSSKATPNKQDDLTTKADCTPLAQLLCPYCDKKFTTKLSVSKHARRIHLSTPKQDNFISCLFCNHSEAMSNDIIRHMVAIHPNQYFACLECNTRFVSTSTLAEHKLNDCEKQKQAYRSKLRQKTSAVSKKDQKKLNAGDKNPVENKVLKLEPEFAGLVISCELKPLHVHDAVDIEDKITTNLILPSNCGNTVLEKNAVIILDDIQWNRRIPPNFTFRNADADQILSRLGVVHRSPRVGESTRREWLKMIDDTSQKFEKCFDTNFYSRVASNVQENLARFLDGSFNFSPDPDKVIKTRKSKSSAIINTAEGFPILLPHEQYSRNRFDGYMPRAIAPKHKWKWDSNENEKNIIIDPNVIKRDNHVDNCIVTLVSSLDIWTQLRMRRKYEGIFCKAPTEKIEKQNIIDRELKEILESREIPCSSSRVVEYTSSSTAAPVKDDSDFPSFLGLSARASGFEGSVQPAVLSGEWVRPRCYVCCACGDQTRDSRSLTAHMAAHHPNAQVQHYEIVGESLLNADILKHLYVPPSQMPNRTRPLRGFRDCTKCKKSITMEDLHQHMLDCAGDTPTVRRKCRSRPFGVRRRRPRLPDNTIRKKMRKDLRTQHNQKGLLRARPRIRTEVGDAETIRKMIADLPAKRHRQAAGHAAQQVLRPRRKLDKQRSKLKIKRLTSKDARKVQPKKDTNDSSVIDEDDQPLKPKTKIDPKKKVPVKKRFSRRVVASRNKKLSLASTKEVQTLNEHQLDAPNSKTSASQTQKISSEDSTQRLNISARGNDNRGEGENSDGVDNNDNDDVHEKPSDEDRDKDIGKGVTPNPTLLKHSINNITASTSNKTLHLQHLLSQQANVVEKTNESRISFLENEVVSSTPDKPPLQTNQNSSSAKKRQSLLNCIEKIKSQQKVETMCDRTMMIKLDQRAMENAHLPLLDPHPAVICRTRDESGTAKNVVPDNMSGPQMHVADELYQTEKDRSYQCYSETVNQRKPNETIMLAPIVEPMYLQGKSSDSEFASPRAKMHSVGQRRKSSGTLSSLAQNDYEQVNQFRYPQIIQPHEWGLMHVDPVSYVRMIQPQTRQHIQPSQRLPFPENVTQQLHCGEAYTNETINYQNQSFSVSAQYNTSDIHCEETRDNVPRRNETASLLICNPHQNQNISSLSPQSWNREITRIQQAYNNHAMPSMLPSTTANELVVPIIRRISQKRISESSESDLFGNCRSLGDAKMLNYSSSSETTANIYVPPMSQDNRESSQYYDTLKRPRAQKDAGYNKSIDFMSFTQDDYGRTYDYMGAVSDSVSKSAEHYQTAQSYSVSTVNNGNFVTPIDIEEHSSGNSIDDSHLVSHKDLVPKSLYSSKLNKKKFHDRYLAEHPHLSPSVPTETQAAKVTPSPNHITILKSLTIQTRDQNEDNIHSNLPVSANKVLVTKKHTPYSEVRDHQETSEDQSEPELTDEPLDLSGKKAPAGYINEPQTYFPKILSSKLEDCKQKNAQIDFRYIDSAIDHHEENEDVPSNLLLQDSRSVDYTSNDTFIQEHGQCMIEQNNADEKLIQSSCKRSTVAYNKEANEIKTGSHDIMDENRSLNIRDENVSNNDVVKSEIKKVFKSNLDLQSSGASSSPNSNDCLTSNVTLDRLDKMNETFSSACENQRLLKTTKATTVEIMQSINSTYHANTEGMEKVNYTSPTSQKNTSHYRGTSEQILKNSRSPDSMYVQNQVFETCIEKNSCLAVNKTDVNDTNTTTTSPPSDQDPETAKKIAMFPKELVDLLGAVPKEQHNRFVNVISQLIPAANHEAVKPLITVQTPHDVKQDVQEQSAKACTSSVCDTSTNYAVNRLTVNTAVIPSSSIIPKKRHSPSARPNSQDAYSNMLLLRPSSILNQQTSPIMTSITDSDQIFLKNKLNEKSQDPSTGIIKNISEINECEPNKRTVDKVDLTDNDLNHPETMPNTLNLNVLPIQDSAPKQQVTSKNSNEKTASLRAVRIKPPLARKSISDDKQPMVTKQVYSQKSTCLDLRQKDLNTTQSSHPECGHINLTVDSIAAQNTEYHANIHKGEAEKKVATENFANIASDTSNFMSMAACEHTEQMEIGAVTSDVVSEEVKMINEKFNSAMKHLPSFNRMEQKNISMPHERNTCDNYKETLPAKTKETENVAGKNTEHDIFLGSSQSTFHDEGEGSKENYTNISTSGTAPTLGLKQDASMPDSPYLICPQEIYNSEGNDLSVDTKSAKIIDIDLHVNDTQQIIKTNEISDTIKSLKPALKIIQDFADDTAPKSKFSEDEDSDDDISLAVIVKQKQQGQTSAGINGACSSVINKGIIANQTNKEKKPRNKSKKPSKKLSHTNYSESLPINSTLNCVDSEEESNANKQHTTNLDKTADAAIESLVNKIKQDDENNEFDINEENGTSENSSKKEDDIITVPENTSVENAEQTYVSYAPNEQNIKGLALINTIEYIDVDSEVKEPLCKSKSQDILIKDFTNGEIESNSKKIRKNTDSVKKMYANRYIEKFTENIDSVEPQVVKNKLLSEQLSSDISQEANSNQSLNADEEKVLLIDDKTRNMCKIQNNPTKHQSLPGDMEIVSSTRQRSKKLKNNSLTVESVFVSDSELSTDSKETSKRALRRSKRGKSMFLDERNLVDIDAGHTTEISNATINKIPVTKKQLIFSKLLQDEREQITNLIPSASESDVTFASAIDTKIDGSTKSKKSSGITKNKKKHASHLKPEDLFDSFDNNNKNIIEKELSCPDTSSKTYHFDSGAIEIEKIFELNHDNSDILTMSKEKRKLNVSLYNDTSYASKRKRTKIDNTTDNTFKLLQESKTDEYTIYTNTEIGSNTERSETAIVKSNNSENTIDNVHTQNTVDYNDSKKQPEKTGTSIEIRTACYNRPIVGKKVCSTSVPAKNPENYDPYDIDMDMDIGEPKLLISKRKSNKTVSGSNSSKTSKKFSNYEGFIPKLHQEPAIEKHVLAIPNTTTHNISDSDSSISDVPLQKYVEEKEKLKIEIIKPSDCNKPETDTEPNSTVVDASESHNIDLCVLASQCAKKTIIDDDEHAYESNVIKSSTPPILMSSNDIDKTDNITDITPDRKDNTTDKINIKLNQGDDQIENITETSTVKSNNKQKKNRRSMTSNKKELVNACDETDQQLSSDKYMENFGFYSVRKPRKSNLLASKKISETFHMIESDDAYFRSKDRQRKSSHTENRKATDGTHTLKATQDAPNSNSDRKSSTIQSIPQQDAGETNSVDELNQANYGEVDFITAQKMLESEEIRKLERDLYSGFKEAAEANAGKTSGFNHLRAEESNLYSKTRDLFTPDVEMETIRSPEKLNSLERSVSPELPESPESLLKDKPLMYPEEEVNIYEDKYDIIKRRREASANAKQVQKVDKPRKRKHGNTKKKAETKSSKKCTKKPYQVSQVPTKGALKGFDGIKISIPTQDLNMPPNVSPPHHQQRQSRLKKRKVSLGKLRTNSGSSCKSDSGAKSKDISTPDIYEFHDDERPVTKGYRLPRVIDKCRSSSSENEEKTKCKPNVNQLENDIIIAKQNEDFNAKRHDQEIERTKTRKWKGKGTGKGKRKYFEDNEINKETGTEEGKRNRKQKQKEEKESNFGKRTYETKIERRIDCREELVNTIVEGDSLSSDYKNTSGTLQGNGEIFDDSDTEEQTVMPGTSGFVPDRNDESSYESDSSSPTPLLSVLKGPYACTCLSEIDSDDSETERGCAHTSCRYSHLNAAKNAVMGKIFKNNAVRCDKFDDSPEEPPKPKPDLDRLFDSLLESNTNNNSPVSRSNISHGPCPSSATHDANDENCPNEHQIYKPLHEREVSNVDDGFSSPNHRHSEKVTKKVFVCASQTFQNDTNSSKVDEASTYNFGEKIDEPIDNERYIMMSEKHIQTEDPGQIAAPEASDIPVGLDVSDKPEQSSTSSIKTSDDIFDNLDKVPESSDYIVLKNKHVEVNKTRGTQTKRSIPQSDVETSSCELELNVTKLARRNRRANKKHKSHHKRIKLCEDEELEDTHRDGKDTSSSKQNNRPHNAIEESETKSEEKRSIEKRPPSRKSDEGISTSHDNSADAYDMAPGEDTGMAVQRARRKCTVGKQNVLAEHWSSSESETGGAPNRLKGRKNSVGKKSSRLGKRDRTSGRSRGGESDGEEAGGSRAPKVRQRTALARDQDSGSEAECDNKEQELHGWIVGRSQKKLVTMLACCKSKPRVDEKEQEKE